MWPPDADYLVRGYKHGQLLRVTWHVGESSKRIEVEVWKTRIARGEATRYEVVALRQQVIVEQYP